MVSVLKNREWRDNMTMVQKNGYTVSLKPMALAVSWVSQNDFPVDSYPDHFSFIIYSVSPEWFCKTLENIFINAQDSETYHVPDSVVSDGVSWVDRIRIERHGRSLTITRGNLRVLYHADYGPLIGLCKVIRKAIKQDL
jgi:hypothetical protein